MGFEAKGRLSAVVARVVVAAGAAFACVVGPAGCTPAVAVCEEKISIIDVRAWAFVEPADDRRWPAPDDAALCDNDDVQVQPVGDDLALEIDTRLGCGWATAQQPTLRDLHVGDRLQVQVFYFSQSSFPTAEAQVAIAIDDDVVLDERITIPATSGLLQPVLTIDNDIAAGASAAFHIGNHGDNSWNLVELAVLTSLPCDQLDDD